jgi:tRNA (guanine37-N1)-methyltransferase
VTFDVITLFPDMFKGPFDESIIKRAKETGRTHIKLHNLRDWAVDSYGTVDGKPFGGGAGMILRVDVVAKALKKVKVGGKRVILLSPQGKPFNQKKAYELSKLENIILICGHYEGFDERVKKLVDEEISVGPYILTGGEIPAMVIIDAVTRLIPGVIKERSLCEESFSEKYSEAKSQKLTAKSYLEYPQYTHPRKYKNWEVPEILLGGNHGAIEKWKRKSTRKSI